MRKIDIIEEKLLEEDAEEYEDIYSENLQEDLLEDDEISPMEEAFMHGFIRT